MSTQHTPGPWHVVLLDADETAAVIRAGNVQIAGVNYASDYAEQHNANLIAAAPKLLAACAAAMAGCPSWAKTVHEAYAEATGGAA